jgi:glutamate-1-semialdehyde 2,1-aminomutase|tara:strand:- start:4628 stop:6658 length:2031 start_codon:yes stop_codon:yes gene_type:complete
MKVLAIVQARMGSTRLPGKVMKQVNGMPLIEILLKRLSCSKLVDEIIIATTSNKNENILKDHVKKLGFEYSTGSQDNVLERFYDAAKNNNADIIVRITADCPLIDSSLVDEAVKCFIDGKYDYVCNTLPPTFPDGLDIEVMSFNALKNAFTKATDTNDKEHVTPFIRRDTSLKKFNIKNKLDLSSYRWTVDELSDFEVVSNIFNHFSPNIDFSWKKVSNLYKDNPNLFSANKKIMRNEGASMGSGQKLWKRAKEIIPGGNMLLSKRSEMFLPEKWPSYFSKSKGCKVWDLDNNEYIDMSIMGIGTNTLGYGNSQVDESVKKTIENGNMSTLNCPEEVYLAEKLIEINPWADMVRYARSGGEANAIAIRIARAASGKDNVAICGYHGWHDWYLAANLNSASGLNDHLLPGLDPNGVPKNLEGTVFPFHYNNFEELEELVNTYDIGTIKMEVVRSEGPENNYLQKVRDLATSKGIILIFDECTSGFRETFGGIHQKFGIEPDMAMYGKALGNGYAITATVGKKEIMEAAQSTFISSTFWTERIGPSAALKTLEVMEGMKSYEKISETGRNIKKGWEELASSNDIKIKISGIDALPIFTFESKNNLLYKTFLTQEMLKKGYLAANSVYVCTEHSDLIVKKYLDELDLVFSKLKKFEDMKEDISTMVDSPICHSGFSRLN